MDEPRQRMGLGIALFVGAFVVLVAGAWWAVLLYSDGLKQPLPFGIGLAALVLVAATALAVVMLVRSLPDLRGPPRVRRRPRP